MPSNWKRWTTGEERAAVALRRSGLKVAAVARRLGRSPGSVMMKLMTLGAVTRCPNRRRSGCLLRAVRPYAGTMPDWEIGYILNVSREAVQKARTRLGVPAFDRKQSARRKGADRAV